MRVEVPLGGVTDCQTKDTLLTGAKGRTLRLGHGVCLSRAGWKDNLGQAGNERQRVKGGEALKKEKKIAEKIRSGFRSARSCAG